MFSGWRQVTTSAKFRRNIRRPAMEDVFIVVNDQYFSAFILHVPSLPILSGIVHLMSDFVQFDDKSEVNFRKYS